jgi:hypothetical protein
MMNHPQFQNFNMAYPQQVMPANFGYMPGMMPMQMQQPMQNDDVIANAILYVGESRDDKKRKEDKIKEMRLSNSSPAIGTHFMAQVRKQLLIHGINPDDPYTKSTLLAKVYSALPVDIQVACEAQDMNQMFQFLELMSEKFTSEADIVALLAKSV